MFDCILSPPVQYKHTHTHTHAAYCDFHYNRTVKPQFTGVTDTSGIFKLAFLTTLLFRCWLYCYSDKSIWLTPMPAIKAKHAHTHTHTTRLNLGKSVKQSWGSIVLILEMNLSSSFLLSLYVSQSLMCKVYNSTSLFFSFLNINTKKPLLSPKWNSYKWCLK